MTNAVVATEKKDQQLTILLQTFKSINIGTLINKNVQNLLKYDNKFDVIIYDAPGTDIMFGFVHRFNAPGILFSPFGDIPMMSAYTGNFYPLSYLPGTYEGLSYDATSFRARLKNVLVATFERLYWAYKFPDIINEIYEKYFPDAPPVDEMRKKIDLVLLNSHYTYEAPRPYTPNIIQIGGFNLVDMQPIEPNLKQWLDDAKEGVVFVSYGTKIKGFAFDEEKIENFINSFSKLKQKVLWKFDDKNIKNLPTNVRIENWLPQKEILSKLNDK